MKVRAGRPVHPTVKALIGPVGIERRIIAGIKAQRGALIGPVGIESQSFLRSYPLEFFALIGPVGIERTGLPYLKPAHHML